MERLTYFDHGHWNLKIKDTVYYDFPFVDRLAAYEDTGLEPEEINELLHMSYCPLHKKIGEWIDAEKDGQLTILKPNDPLTLEELREMDGEPVWVKWGGHSQEGWALVRVWSKVNNVIYLTYHNGSGDLLGFVLNNGGKIYRRKPEEVN